MAALKVDAFASRKALQPFRTEIAAEREHELDLIEKSVRACFEELTKKRDAVLNASPPVEPKLAASVRFQDFNLATR